MDSFSLEIIMIVILAAAFLVLGLVFIGGLRPPGIGGV